jgi:hypothetical protein
MKCAVVLLASLLIQFRAQAQEIIHADETLASSRPEAWAMNYMAASSFLTSFGATPALKPWGWEIAGDLGHVPSLSDSQQRVGFNGTKQEDLNRSPVFGRVRAMLGLPGGLVAELGYTPSVTIDGVKALDLFALALGYRVYEHDNFSLSMRAIGQRGRATGDITCPARLVHASAQDNPYGCQAPSTDRVTLNYYGIDTTAAWNWKPWNVHANLGVARTDLAVQVDAFTFDVHDRSLLQATASKPYIAIGGSRDFDARWNLGAEILYVPLRVQRDANSSTSNDPLTSFRLQLRYRFG